MIWAVVLAAGASSRFGSPKQALLLEPVLERVRASSVDDVLVVLGAHELESSRAHGPLPRLGARARRLAALRARALPDDAEAAVVVLGDGPGLAPGRDRPPGRRLARASRRRSSPPPTAASACIRCCSHARSGRRFRTRARRISTPSSSPATICTLQETSISPMNCRKAETVELARPLAAEPSGADLAADGAAPAAQADRRGGREARRALARPGRVARGGPPLPLPEQQRRRAGAASLRDLARDRPPRGAPALGPAGRASASAPDRALDRRRTAAASSSRVATALVLAFGRGSSPSAARTAAATLPPPWKFIVDVLNGDGDINYTRRWPTASARSATASEHVTQANRFGYKQTVVYFEPGGRRRRAPRRAARLRDLSPLPGGTNARRLVVIAGPASATC